VSRASRSALRAARGGMGDRTARGPARARGAGLRQVYPQVDPGAAGLVDVAVVAVPGQARVGDALRAARAAAAGLAAVGDRWVLRDDLARASNLGLDELAAATLARPLPVVDARSPEVGVRRLLAAGAALVVVRDRRATVGAVAPPATMAVEGPRLGPRFGERLPPPVRQVLELVRRLAGTQGARVFLAGGTVRDALLETPGARRDVDVAVEGDGLALARALAHELGPSSALIEHARFLTASVTVEGVGRIDVATARSERYEAPGALPRVLPATIGQDLARRDFTVNALAVELASGGFGLLDLHGGRADLARRRIRVLHPLSFVEDPTRVFRAARYATRLGFALDAWTADVQALALRRPAYAALSGPRLVAEIELVLGDARPAVTLRRLGAAGAFRLLDPRYRFTRASAAAVAALPSTLEWVRACGLRAAPVELAVLAVLAGQPLDVARAALARLGFSGDPLARLRRALETTADTLRALAAARRPSERARLLRDRAEVELAWLALAGPATARAAVAWFIERGRAVRPALSGDDVQALGVPRGADLARLLGALRDARLDGVVADGEAEAAYVRDWLRDLQVHRSPDRRGPEAVPGLPDGE
jgi:tRNA nucleotidyltransferase (CCA-adding enzyme)